MKIGFDYRMAGTRNGGIGRYSHELLKELLATSSRDQFYIFYRPSTASEKDLAELEKFPNANLIPADYRHYSFSEQIFFPRLLKKYRLDMMHFPNFNIPIFYKGKFVVTIHDMVHHRLSGHKIRTLLHFFAYKYIIEQAVKKSQKIITVSDSSKQDILAIFQVHPDKIRVIYEGVTSQEVSAEFVEHVRHRLILPRPYFIFVGVLERKKNIPGLTKAFDYFIEKYHLDMDLVIVGKPDPHYPQIKDQSLTVKNKHRIIFTGFVSDDELAALYTGAYAFVSLSQYEGFGLPGVEAMAYHLPVLAANTPIYNEVYDNAALYFNPQDPEDVASKMELLARDPQFYEQCQSKSFERSKMFSWRLSAKETKQIYKESLLIQT